MQEQPRPPKHNRYQSLACAHYSQNIFTALLSNGELKLLSKLLSSLPWGFTSLVIVRTAGRLIETVLVFYFRRWLTRGLTHLAWWRQGSPVCVWWPPPCWIWAGSLCGPDPCRPSAAAERWSDLQGWREKMERGGGGRERKTDWATSRLTRKREITERKVQRWRWRGRRIAAGEHELNWTHTQVYMKFIKVCPAATHQIYLWLFPNQFFLFTSAKS